MTYLAAVAKTLQFFMYACCHVNIRASDLSNERDEALAICYDSVYAKNVTTGFWKPRKNKGIAKMCIDALRRVL